MLQAAAQEAAEALPAAAYPEASQDWAAEAAEHQAGRTRALGPLRAADPEGAEEQPPRRAPAWAEQAAHARASSRSGTASSGNPRAVAGA